MSDDIHKVKQQSTKPRLLMIAGKTLLVALLIISAGIIGTIGYLLWFDHEYQEEIYPQVFIDSYQAGGKTVQAVKTDWDKKNQQYQDAVFELRLDAYVATLSGKQLNLGYDSALLARQAFLVGRSGNILSDIFTKLMKGKTIISPYFRWDDDMLVSQLSDLASSQDIKPKDARFQFENGKVITFEPAKPGKRLHQALAIDQFKEIIKNIPFTDQRLYPINLEIETVQPTIDTADSNSFGIKEIIGEGYSEFAGSIPGRIYNVGLAASKFNGILIQPGEVFSFNKVIGDISAATGYQSAYIIKEGRTVLGDGGGVCQVSTTVFRAALQAGLPIVDWTPHAYRVSYYEQAGYKPGLDATIFEPSVDLQFKNDTGHHILIQTETNKKDLTLNVRFFGTSDGRKTEILNHQILSQTPPPPPLYQDDPSLPPGVVKQIDWAAWGARTSFQYKVTRKGEIIIDRNFSANFRPWQAVYLRGPQI